MAPQKIKQWKSGQNGLDKLYMEEAEIPTPGEDEVLVEIRSVSLNYRDTEVCMGLYNHHKHVKQPPAVVPGSDMCGIVVAVGPSSNTSDPYKSPDFVLKEGDRVVSTFAQTHITGQVQARDLTNGLGSPLPGVLTQYRIFPTHGLLKVPKYLSFDEAACLPIAAVTAWMSLNCMRPNGDIIGVGETVVCQGTGGVSISAAQIASAAGADVIVTSSSDEKLEKAKQLGAKQVINYRNTPEWDDEVLRLTSDRGADVVIEVGGAQTLRKSFEAVRFGGLIACIGYLSGKQDAEGDRTNTNLLCLKRNVTLKGIINGPRDEFARMLKFYEDKQIHPVVDKVFKFDEADKALQYLFTGGHFGKVVVMVKEE
ncbi:NAD(P)-binding protein [Didymella exigua CBS 183.55]|uniref:NAD(P)-binding protein n=1 Tax=Didymella exigua CBS 183.55 TaxID=1150837 RepID=A0A6A5RSC3_9PLEO|nr:NAD(P)-binding protein [Didymella exigua CBS 183.55]KAF1931351.1 NAD(P)-binding protein [Didymella exigua CBS 183.55]